MGSVGYIISGLISTLICACACKLCKKRGSRWIRRFMETDTQDSQSEGQVEEVSSFGAVIEMQEFSDSDDNTYEVPVSPPSTVVDGLNPVGFVSTSTNTETVHLHHVVLPSPFPQEEEQSGAVVVNDQTLHKTVEEKHDPYPHTPPKGWLPPVMNTAPGSISIPLKEKILLN